MTAERWLFLRDKNKQTSSSSNVVLAEGKSACKDIRLTDLFLLSTFLFFPAMPGDPPRGLPALAIKAPKTSWDSRLSRQLVSKVLC